MKSMLFFLFGSSPLFCYTRLQWTKEGMIASTLTNIKMEETVPVLRLLWKERKTLVETFEGLLIDTYVLQEQPMMLTGINLQLEDRVINGLLKDRYLAKYILRLPLNKYVLEVSGKWNRRNQLVIKKMLIKNIDEYIKIIGTPE
ncbi:hypothetical protein A5839_001253 [Enterococcus faecium]|nr:hypothetical protein OGO_00766 [Enterococcus faecium EnGen0015]ELB32061.1 hypothetical protein OK5_02991 [Enterococcus faecium EnGen0042]MBL4994396.1 hypothetical protein [Enterococcus lactis]OTP02582.1 hypothetical protein A5856_002027 [Enterococcus faecium]OTP04061.1 hypothetical protein A5839_001253 [Enterococcus faecium]